jgi:hypothetical protein
MSQTQSVRGVVRFLGSLTFLIILLSLMLVALILPTVINQINPKYGYDSSVGALRRDWYGAWWFNILMFLLMVNLAVCTVIRTPWRYFWMWGFLITHSGILTLMIGAAVTFNTKIYGDLQAIEGGHYDYFTIEHENEIAVRSSGGGHDSFQLWMNPYRPSSERKSFRLQDSSVLIHVDEFVPNVAFEPTYREDPKGRETVAEVAVHVPEGEPKKTYLKLDHPMYLGPMAFEALSLSDAGFAALGEKPPDRPVLAITNGGETREIEYEADKDRAVRVGDADFTVKRSGGPVQGLRDYWVEFEITRPGQEPEAWMALALTADRTPFRPGKGPAEAGFQARVRRRISPAELHGPETKGTLIFCGTPSGVKYLYLSQSGERVAGSANPGSRIANPFMPMPFETEMVRWLEHAEETAEATEPKKNRPRNPALRITVASDSHKETRWVKFFGEPVLFQAGDQVVEIAYRGRRYRDLPFSIALDDFRVRFNRGTRQASHFESDLTLTDLESGEVTKQTIEVNTPMKYKGFVIYQASWNPDDTRMSIFQISKDPGKKVLYLGWVMAVSGSIFMFFLKPFLQRLIKSGSRGADAPLGSGAALLLFALVTLGTAAGVVAPLAFPGVDALWLGLAVAGADLVLALVVALVARAWHVSKPVRALQAGEILAGGWCLNTAALVILLMLKVTA